MTGLQPFDPWSILFIAALNPAVIVVALLMGRAADQRQKILVAAFAAAIAGSALVWAATFLDLLPAKGVGGEGGVFVVQVLLGLFWAWIGFMTRPGAPRAP